MAKAKSNMGPIVDAHGLLATRVLVFQRMSSHICRRVSITTDFSLLLEPLLSEFALIHSFLKDSRGLKFFSFKEMNL